MPVPEIENMVLLHVKTIIYYHDQKVHHIYSRV